MGRILRTLTLLLTLPLSSLQAQDYLLMKESFETLEDSLWTLYSATKSNEISYTGETAVEIFSQGSAQRILNIPHGVNEVIISGYIKVTGYDKNAKESKKEEKLRTSFKDTIDLPTLVIQSNKAYESATLSIDTYGHEAFIFDGNVGIVRRNTSWKYFEKSIMLPPGTHNIQITCRNAFDNAVAYFDEIKVEKRQVGFVKKETAWADAYRKLQARNNALVQNGDFEDGAENWNTYWGFELTDIAHKGENACLIQNSDSGAWKGSGNNKLFFIPEGTSKLLVTAWIKADNVVGGPNTWETGAILLNFTDEMGNEIPGGGDVARTVGTHDWRKFEAYFDVSERAKGFNLLLQLAASTGKLYIDDLFAKPLSDEEYYKIKVNLQNPGFENQLNGWPSYAGLTTKEEAKSGEYSLKVHGEQAAWEMRMQTIMLEQEKDSITFSGWIKTIGITETPNSWEGARMYVEFKNIHGIKLGDVAVGQAVGDTDWQFFSKRVAIPEGAVEATISCGRANVSGAAYFDDIDIKYD